MYITVLVDFWSLANFKINVDQVLVEGGGFVVDSRI